MERSQKEQQSLSEDRECRANLAKVSSIGSRRLANRFKSYYAVNKRPASKNNEPAALSSNNSDEADPQRGPITHQPTTSDDDMLERLAAEELSKEASKARARADVGGPSEWTKKPKRLNLKFVVNSVLQTEAQNKRRTSKK